MVLVVVVVVVASKALELGHKLNGRQFDGLRLAANETRFCIDLYSKPRKSALCAHSNWPLDQLLSP